MNRHTPPAKRRSQVAEISGHDFTVGILFFNKVEQTKHCISSFIESAVNPPAIIILNNDSDPEEASELQSWIKNSKYKTVRILNSQTNLGVGPGRNYIVANCRTSYIMFVDNDIVVHTPHYDLAIRKRLGADDVDCLLPILFHVHELRFNRIYTLERLDEGIKHVPQPEDSMAAASFIQGGASIVRTALLKQYPFNKDMKIGWEDLELSVRLMDSDENVRIQRLSTVELHHLHAFVDSKSSTSTISARYSVEDLSQSADVFAQQTGVRIDDTWIKWTTNQRELMLSGMSQLEDIRRLIGRREDEILFVADQRDWAFDSIAQELSRRVGGTAKTRIIYSEAFSNPKVAARVIFDGCRIPRHVHFMWRATYFSLLRSPAFIDEIAKIFSVDTDGAQNILCAVYVTSSVADYAFIDDTSLIDNLPTFWMLDDYTVICPGLKKFYQNILGYKKPAAFIPDVTEIEYLPSDRLMDKKTTGNALRVAWIGNSEWGKATGLHDYKGLATIIEPAIAQIRSDGIDVDFVKIDKAEKALPRAEVLSILEDCDVVLCASIDEGGPLTIVEAMTRGCCVVSTDVGIVKTLLPADQHSFIVKRTPAAFASAIKILSNNPDLRLMLQKENIECAQQFIEGAQDRWTQFFAKAAHKSNNNLSGAILKRKIFSILQKGRLDASIPMVVPHYLGSDFKQLDCQTRNTPAAKARRVLGPSGGGVRSDVRHAHLIVCDTAAYDLFETLAAVASISRTPIDVIGVNDGMDYILSRLAENERGAKRIICCELDRLPDETFDVRRLAGQVDNVGVLFSSNPVYAAIMMAARKIRSGHDPRYGEIKGGGMRINTDCIAELVEYHNSFAPRLHAPLRRQPHGILSLDQFVHRSSRARMIRTILDYFGEYGASIPQPMGKPALTAGMQEIKNKAEIAQVMGDDPQLSKFMGFLK